MTLTDQDLHGRVVISHDGVAIGEITNLLINGSNFGIEAIEVRLRKHTAEMLGASRSFLHPALLRIPAGAIQSVGDAVILTIPVESLGPLLARREREAAPARA